MRHFGSETSFWEGLVARAGALGVERLLYYGLRFADRLLGTPVPVEAIRAIERAAPPRPVRLAMDVLVTEAIVPGHAIRPRRMLFARGLLSVRHHWLRMPPLLLVRHVLHKALAARSKGSGGAGAA